MFESLPNNERQSIQKGFGLGSIECQPTLIVAEIFLCDQNKDCPLKKQGFRS